MMLVLVEINVLVDEDLTGCPDAAWLESVAEKALSAHGVDSRTELGLVIVGQERIRQLNRSYLGKDEPTDVLAFALLPEPSDKSLAPFVLPPDGISHLGEVIVAYPQAVIQAEERQHSVRKEIALLIIHGVLHLLGYDHDEPEAEREMRARETAVLSDIENELL